MVWGDILLGCVVYGFIVDGIWLIIFGGMIEYGRYFNEVNIFFCVFYINFIFVF